MANEDFRHHHEHPTHQEIAKLAYEMWKARFGDVDTSKGVEIEIWLEAQMLLERHFEPQPETKIEEIEAEEHVRAQTETPEDNSPSRN